jgi:hypothetical protein
MMIKQKMCLVFLGISMTVFSYKIFAVCTKGSSLQQSRSRELTHLLVDVRQDREETNGELPKNKKEKDKLEKRNLERRKRVKQIYTEGCFKSAKDYANAAEIYWHGSTVNDYYQAYLWQRRAGEISNDNDMVAKAIDAYLLATERKQLFGSQISIEYLPSKEPCLCTAPVESSFPDSLRKSYSGYSLKERHDLAAIGTGIKKDCPMSCDDSALKPTPRGSIPGIW